MHLACRTYLADDGVGLARGDLSDPDGLIGEVAQPCLCRNASQTTASPDSVNAQAYLGPSDGPVNTAGASAGSTTTDAVQGTGE